MKVDEIAELGIDPAGSLYMRPKTRTFPYIYRAAMGVGWDDAKTRLFSPRPKEWSYARWFQQILAAAADEYGVQLKISPTTIWSGISDELRSEIAASSS